MPKTAIVSSGEEDNVIYKFYTWLQTTDGGEKSKRQADKHRNLAMQAVHQAGVLEEAGDANSKACTRSQV